MFVYTTRVMLAIWSTHRCLADNDRKIETKATGPSATPQDGNIDEMFGQLLVSDLLTGDGDTKI